MTESEASLRDAASTRIDFGDDVLTFAYTNVDGVAWRGCVEEWIGNAGDSLEALADPIVEHDGTRYFQIGASGGGADLVLLRDDDATVWYLNDYDRTLSRVAKNVSEFVALLQSPDGE